MSASDGPQHTDLHVSTSAVRTAETRQEHNMSSWSGSLLVSGAPAFGPGQPAAECEPSGAAGDRSTGIGGLKSPRASCVSWKTLRHRATPGWPTEHMTAFSPGMMACQPAPTAPGLTVRGTSEHRAVDVKMAPSFTWETRLGDLHLGLTQASNLHLEPPPCVPIPSLLLSLLNFQYQPRAACLRFPHPSCCFQPPDPCDLYCWPASLSLSRLTLH